GVFDRFSDVGDDLRRQTFAPGRVVELFGVVAQIFIVEQPFDRGRPEERAQGHIRRALADHRDDVGRVFGRRRQAGVLEAIDSGLQPTANLFGAVRMRDHREPVLCASSTTALTSSIVIWSWSISFMTLTPASASLRTLARASSTPLTPQRKYSVPG